MVRTLHFHCGGPGFNPSLGTKILEAAHRCQKQKTNTLYRASLAAQWLIIRLPAQGTGFEPWSGKIPHATEQLSSWATTTEPAL